MWKYYVTYNVLSIIFSATWGHESIGFDDTVLFKINWPGKSNTELSKPQKNIEPYFITTADNEQYQCLIPDTGEQKHNNAEEYKGLNPIGILLVLFRHNTCSYRLETYWTYELCHGNFVRQYHEDKEGKKVKTQEYLLGTFDMSETVKLSIKYNELEKNANKKAEIPMIKVDGINMPYVEIKMGGGTLCDLNNKPRMIRVLYVCYQYGKHEIFSLKETSSCEYEAIVLSPLLCNHPDYKPQESGENEIMCSPVNNAPKKPKALISMEMESWKLRHQKVTDGNARVRVEIRPVDVPDKHNNGEDSVNSLTDQNINPTKINSVQNFLSGKNCLHGGNGWWKYEFCYGRSVVQYHIEKDGTKTIVNLGRFDRRKHLEWIATHPFKKPGPREGRKHLSHFYSDGSMCNKTGRLRQTEVKLKCVENHMGSPFSVSLLLLEPRTCRYVLRVDSPLICDILEYADENGLFSETFETDFSKLKTTTREEQNDLNERIANGDD